MKKLLFLALSAYSTLALSESFPVAIIFNPNSHTTYFKVTIPSDYSSLEALGYYDQWFPTHFTQFTSGDWQQYNNLPDRSYLASYSKSAPETIYYTLTLSNQASDTAPYCAIKFTGTTANPTYYEITHNDLKLCSVTNQENQYFIYAQ